MTNTKKNENPYCNLITRLNAMGTCELLWVHHGIPGVTAHAAELLDAIDDGMSALQVLRDRLTGQEAAECDDDQDQVDKAREQLAAGRSAIEVSDELGIPIATVSKIIADAIQHTALRKFAELSGR